MAEKQQCPTCKQSYKTGGRGIESHIRQAHGADALKAWKSGTATAVTDRHIPGGKNGNGQYVELALSNGMVLKIEKQHGFQIVTEILNELQRNGHV